MSRHPLTVYLERSALLAVEKHARAAGIPKSAWAGQALQKALTGTGGSPDLLLEQTLKVRATLDELVAAHPAKDAMRKRIDLRVERYLIKANEAAGA